MGFTVDIDTGGTFTDGFFVRDGDVRTVKVPTTPHDLTVCFLECIQAGARAFGREAPELLFETDIIRFSNTIGTNTIIQRNGAKIGLIVTRGMESLAPTARTDGKAPLVYDDMVIGLDEEVDAHGTVVRAPAAKAILEAAQTLIDRGARGLVVALENSEFNPANERDVRAVIKREYPRDYLGSVSTFLASDISTRPGKAERLNAAVLNAYIHGKLARLLYKAGEDLRQRQYRGTLFIGHNNGAVARVAKTRAINTYNSGPAGGLFGAREIGRLYGFDTLISTDMGGTSFDIGYVEGGQASYALRPDVEGFACNLPMMAIDALGAGGGSIAHVEDGVLKVGPQSAGALPGPVCFGLGGTQPTVTDANLVLGILDSGYFLGGGMRLDVDKARAAIDAQIAQPLGVSVEEAAWRIKTTVEAAMGAAVGAVADRLGRPARLPTIAYGGAGGIHACDIAREAGLDVVLMTPFSAVSSAYGSSLMDAGHIYYRRTDRTIAGPQDFAAIAGAVADTRAEAERDMRGEGFDVADINADLQLFFSAGDGGQEAIVAAPLSVLDDSAAATEVLRAAHEALGSEGPLQLTTLAYFAKAPVPHFHLPELPPATREVAQANKGSRPVYLDPRRGRVEVAIYDRDMLQRDHQLFGPAIVESVQTSVFVPAGWRLTVDRFNNLLLERV